MLFPMLGVLAVLCLENKASTGNSVTAWTFNVRALVGSIGPAFKTLFIISSVSLVVIVLLYGAQWRLIFDGTYNAITHYRGGHPAFLLGRYSTLSEFQKRESATSVSFNPCGSHIDGGVAEPYERWSQAHSTNLSFSHRIGEQYYDGSI
jgi:hypothetical protein